MNYNIEAVLLKLIINNLESISYSYNFIFPHLNIPADDNLKID